MDLLCVRLIPRARCEMTMTVEIAAASSCDLLSLLAAPGEPDYLDYSKRTDSPRSSSFKGNCSGTPEKEPHAPDCRRGLVDYVGIGDDRG